MAHVCSKMVNGKKFIIVCNVDDLMLLHAHPVEVNKIMECMKNKYVKTRIIRGKNMDLDYSIYLFK